MTKNTSKYIKGTRNLSARVKTAKGRKISSTTWLKRQLNDPYVHLAKQNNYRSRASYKLMQIDDKFDLFKNIKIVIDLGAAPGGWSQVVMERAKQKGNKELKIIALDLLEMERIDGVEFLQGDFLDINIQNQINELLQNKKADLIMSDMAANASGHKETDHLRIIHLCEIAFEFAKKNLAQDGKFIAKVLKGGTENELLKMLKKNFRQVKHFKPEASRKESSELYVIGIGYLVNNNQ